MCDLTAHAACTSVVDYERLYVYNEMNREYVHSVGHAYQKYVMRLEELIIFEPWRENCHSFQPS